tara:strand:- start:1617 stop:3143 length:1527 start_codon:yes stop_codon:yes gene_type:complete
VTNYFKFFFLGSLTFLLFPPYFFLPIGFIVFPYLFYQINYHNLEKSINSIFLQGFFYGLGLNFLLFYWLKNPFFVDDNTKNLFFLSYLFTIYASIYFGLFFVILRFFKNINVQIFVFPIIFIILEILRTKLFLSFPWNIFAYILSNQPYLFSFSKYISIYGVSYIIIVIFLSPILLFNIFNNENKKFNITYLLIILSLIGILSFFNKESAKIDTTKKPYELDVILYQSNIPQNEKWDSDLMESQLNKLLKFIENNSNNFQKTLIIFSETEIPYIISSKQTILKFISSKLDDNTIVIIGGIRKDQKSNSYFNTLFKITQNDVEYFDKKVLVPFGEYIPLINYFPFIKKFILGGTEFTKGKAKRSMRLYEDVYFIPSICFENIFFNKLVSRDNFQNDLIINITNDAWFGKYQGPYQHFYQSIVRAVESNKYLIRVSNNGISAIVDPKGKILYASKLNEKISNKVNLKIQPRMNVEYTEMNFLIFYLYLIISIIFCIFFQIVNKNENKLNS